MPEAEEPVAVGIPVSVGEGVMLPMDGHPLPPAQTRRQPEHRSKEQLRDRVDPEGPMREGPVKVDGRGDHGDLGQRNRHQGNDPGE